jgi:hypothetical protein
MLVTQQSKLSLTWHIIYFNSFIWSADMKQITDCSYNGFCFSVHFTFFFFFICFWRTRGSFCVIFSTFVPHRGQPAAKCHPRWQPTRRLAVSCGLGRRRARTQDCRTTAWHATIEPPRLLNWDTTTPNSLYSSILGFNLMFPVYFSPILSRR